MQKKSIAIYIVAILSITMACAISYEGINFGSDPDVEFVEDQTATAASAQTSVPQASLTTPVPEYRPDSAGGSSAEQVNSGTHEYSVAATNFDCTCQVDGNVTAGFNFKGDQLEYTTPGGSVDVYDKIGENTYKRSFMGYYILSSGSGAQVTETVVEEEKHVVIKITDSGYVMEHYSGTETSPCCYHTFTNVQ
jgi:hypothetical protein